MRYFFTTFLFIFFAAFCVGQTISPSGTATFCNGGSVNLVVNGAPINAIFQWKKDGGDVGVDSNVYSASIAGSYTVVVSGAGTPVTLGPVIVSQTNLNANFTFSPNNQCSNLPVSFTNISVGATAFSWRLLAK